MRRPHLLAEMAEDPNDPRHGTQTGYEYGCRCDRCIAASKAHRLAKSGKQPKAPTLYAMYRGDEWLDVGTADELAARHGIKEVTVRTQSAPSLRRRSAERGGIEYVRLEDD